MSQIIKTLFILVLFAPFILSGTPMKLGIPQEGSIIIDNNYEYYTLELDKNSVPTDFEKTLIIKVEGKKGDQAQRADFSDVDVYVSKENELPTSPATINFVF